MRIDHELIKKLRIQRGWTQLGAAERIGIDERTYRRYEQGKVGEIQRATVTLGCIAQVFGLQGPEVLPLSGRLPALPQMPDAPFDAAWYIHRDEERRARRLLEFPGSPLVLQGPWLFGKSTLLSYLIQDWARPHPSGLPGTVVRVNLGHLHEESVASLDGLLAELGRRLLAQVDPQHGAERAADIWKGLGGAKGKLDRVMTEYVLPAAPRLLLAIERAEELLSCPFQHDFFALLRSWSEAKNQPQWSGLRLAVTLSTLPTLLERIDSSSFFALAQPIKLGELTSEQLGQLVQLYGSSPPLDVLARLESFIGGHPYLWRLALYEAALQERPVAQLLDEVDQHGGIFAPHLLRMRHWVQGEESLAVGQVLEKPDVHLGLDVYGKLYSRGLLIEAKDEGRVYRFRCKLFDDYFRRFYKKENAPT